MKHLENFLDYVPQKNKKVAYKKTLNGEIIIIVTRTHFLERISQWLFLAPKSTEIKLDVYGSFLWNHIDGKRKIWELGVLLKTEYGLETEPLYERLSLYFQALLQNQLVN